METLTTEVYVVQRVRRAAMIQADENLLTLCTPEHMGDSCSEWKTPRSCEERRIHRGILQLSLYGYTIVDV